MLRFIIATRCRTESDFLHDTLTGKSLNWMRYAFPMHVNIGYESSSGVANVYNQAIEIADPEDILIFMHDDIQIDDWQIAFRVLQGLQNFDLIGVAGNVSREPNQINWWGKEVDIDGAQQFIGCGTPKGAIAYAGTQRVEYWSSEPTEVKLLDGVFLAAQRSTMSSNNIRFDPQFLYHMYDMDICRQFEKAGLTMGVWPIALSHQSAGQLNQVWRDAGALFMKKWNS
jgi:protein O-GlcNAc transferase